MDPQRQRLGKKEPKHDPRTVRLSSILPPELPDPRPAVDWESAASSFGPMLNDQYGCCGLAAPGHLIQCMTAANGRQVIVSDGAILKAYQDVGNFVVGRPETDNGVYLLDVMNYWRQIGIGGHKIEAFAAIDLGNQRHLQQAIDIFGGVILGSSLPLSAQGELNWSIAMGGDRGSPKRGSWGGHATSSAKYRDDGSPSDGVGHLSWGEPLRATWPFHDGYTDEGFVVVAKDWADVLRASPSGYLIQALLDRVKEIAS